MIDKPITTTRYAISRVMKDFAIRIGLDPEYADILSQVDVMRTEVLDVWFRFLGTQCSNCERAPTACQFLHPEENSCPEGVAPAEIGNANRIAITERRVVMCPVRTPISPQQPYPEEDVGSGGESE